MDQATCQGVRVDKTQLTKDDGRYIIFYTFGDEPDEQEEGE